MKTKFMLITILILVLSVSVVGQEKSGEAATTKVANAYPLFLWSIIVGCVCLTLAAIGGAWAQSTALQKAVDNMGRNPNAADSIRGILIIGLALIESLVIYVLLIDFIIFFVKWGNYAW